MKKTVLSLAFIIVLLSTILSGTKLLQVAQAPSNPLPYKLPQITVLSPSPNVTYHTPSIPLNVTVQIYGQTPQSLELLNSLNYTLDGQADTPITLAYPSDYGPGYYVNGSTVLSGLSDGIHNLTIHGETTIGAINENFNTTISFTVNTTTPITEPFPTTIVASICGASVAIIGIGLFLYFNKHGRDPNS